ncbi:MAG TPA: diguanylate cyclase, partial [Telluria sp.]|nr:diguanylate cyclase [Telluria sp.]
VNAAVVRARVRTQLTVKRQADALRALSLTDGLTGVANRRAFDDRLDAEWRRCARIRMPVALVLVDIDHFKLFNDHYGHQAGDACLVQAGAAMRRAAGRPQDLVARYGGEEFAILLPQVNEQGAERVAEKLLQELAAMAVPHEASPTSSLLTVSMGIATLVPDEDSAPADLVQAADAQLYEAKAAGRNCYRITGL